MGRPTRTMVSLTLLGLLLACGAGPLRDPLSPASALVPTADHFIYLPLVSRATSAPQVAVSNLREGPQLT